jgi:glucose dehydrogenase
MRIGLPLAFAMATAFATAPIHTVWPRLLPGLSGVEGPGLSEVEGAHPSARHSALTQITRENVSRLTRAWTYHTGELAGGRGPTPGVQVAAFQTRPLFLGTLLYITTPTSRVVALDAETGDARWIYDPQAGAARRCEAPHRGVSVWEGMARDSRPIRTIFSGTCDGRLAALDAETGQPRVGFGDRGLIDLRPGVDARPGESYEVTSPPVIYRDLVIVGAAVPEGSPTGPAGDVRAFDVRSGRLVWQFHTVPRSGEFGHETWTEEARLRRTGVNVWSEMSVDAERGLVFLPIGSASYDFYGGDRPGANLFANSLVALKASTGERIWHQQLVHHDLWDYDLPSQPVLATLRRDGRPVAAVVQVTKMGLVFVFERTTGLPLFPLEERPVPPSDVPGEVVARTQPFPVKPLPLSRHTALRRDELTRVTPESRRECEAMFDAVKSGGIYSPPGRAVTLWFPGTMGGATWSGATIDPDNGLLVVNTNEIGAVGRIEAQPADSPLRFRRTSPWGEYGRFWDSQRLPCQQPPWGRLHAVDLNSGEIVWQVPFGDAPQLASRGVTGTGTPSIGGAISTASGLVFIAATNDSRIRAFDTASGRVLWQGQLDASGHATPVTYRGPRSGRQFVVAAAGGGGRFSSTVADAVVAFALPN